MESWERGEPHSYPVTVVDGFLHDESLLRRVYESLPPSHWDGWVCYDNDSECKRTTRRSPSGLLEELLDILCSPATTSRIAALAGLPDGSLRPDATHHGGGLHVTSAGGHLAPHVDYVVHPDGKSVRRVNLILFAVPVWRESWGGALECWDESGRKVERRIYPAWNRAVIWQPTEKAGQPMRFHGTQRTSHDAPDRVSVATYYLGDAEDGDPRRLRALFVPSRG